MASIMPICTSIQPHVRFKSAAKRSIFVIPRNRSCRIHQAEIKKALRSVHVDSATKRKPLPLSAVSSNDDSTINVTPFSPANTVMLFYSAINDKNLQQLDKLMAEDCLFDDYSFPKTFQGKKDALRFLKQLISCMGQNMQFNIDHICEGNDFTAAVNWHLEWNQIQVPFTRGCSSFLLSLEEDKLVIKKAQVLIESPIKLGGVALATFRIVTSLFDAFPAATEWFLKSPHVIFHLLLNTFKMTIQPIISPFIDWYIKLLNIATIILSFTLKLLYYLAKLFNMSNP